MPQFVKPNLGSDILMAIQTLTRADYLGPQSDRTSAWVTLLLAFMRPLERFATFLPCDFRQFKIP